jgi:hypothetical protein
MKLNQITSLLALSAVTITALPAEKNNDIAAVNVIGIVADAIGLFNDQVNKFEYGDVPETSSLDTLVQSGVSQIERSPTLSAYDVQCLASPVQYLEQRVAEFLNSLARERQTIMNLGRPTIRGWVESIYRDISMISVVTANKGELGSGSYIKDNLFGRVCSDLIQALNKWSNQPQPTVPQLPDAGEVIVSALGTFANDVADLNSAIGRMASPNGNEAAKYGQLLADKEYSFAWKSANGVQAINAAGNYEGIFNKLTAIQGETSNLVSVIYALINTLDSKRYALMQEGLTASVKKVLEVLESGDRDLMGRIISAIPGEFQQNFIEMNNPMWNALREAEYTWN